ncbi:MAG: NADH-quinone oxidoreductase subunit I [Pseudomonadota bacterium]|nr:NADH-quinone oxidoreductase subunit I [Pseudomonadota bacterium]
MSLVKKDAAIDRWFLPGIIAGLFFTIKKMLANIFNRKSMPTLNYPEEKFEYSPRFKGTHILTVKKDGSLRCTACMLCATACPAECINIVAAEHDDPVVEKYPVKYEIDILRCVFCGMCEEACPVDAVRLGPEWQIPGVNGSNFIYDIRFLAYRPALKGGIPSTVEDEERHQAGI